MLTGLRQARRGPRWIELTRSAESRRPFSHPSSVPEPLLVATVRWRLDGFCVVAATNKFLAPINKFRARGKATKSGTHTRFRLKPSRALIMNESIDLLQRHFGLAPAEARLAVHLVAGETLRSAAVKLSISYETARTSLKNIFRKTGTCRQAELVIFILAAPRRLGPQRTNFWRERTNPGTE